MRRAGVPTADSRTFTDAEAAIGHLRALERPPVVKADWLALGKGVVVPETHDQAAEAVHSLLDAGPPGRALLLEERLDGREVSAFALISDENVVPLGAARDYKRLADGGAGPNTGGMGVYAPVPWFDRRALEEAAGTVFEPIAWRMSRGGTPYRGVLYAGLMVTDRGPMVLEFNARFGDPEAQVLLPLLDGDLAAALLATAAGDRSTMESAVALRPGAAVGVVLASEGYPDDPVTGRRLTGADPSGPDDAGPALCFHAGTRRSDGGVATAGGRVATFVGLGEDHAQARERAYGAIGQAQMEGGQHRFDIGLEVGGR
jgi:phosphoribosylamine--glycine ligase